MMPPFMWNVNRGGVRSGMWVFFHIRVPKRPAGGFGTNLWKNAHIPDLTPGPPVLPSAGMHTILAGLAVALFLQTSSTGRLTFTAPAGWTPRPAASTMRVAEFLLPKAAGDVEDGDVVVYFFGGQGGDVEANITRWLGQMQQPDGRASKDLAKRESQTINGLTVTVLDVSGTYIAELRPGAADHFNKPGFRMRTAVVPTPRGPYFVKMLGPEKTIVRWNDSFGTFIRSLKFE
jgi:hypothetical protein